MFGEPKDIPGQCNAHLYIGDNFGDNHATMRCQLTPKHEGKHREVFNRKMDDKEGKVVVEWDLDETESEFADDLTTGDMVETNEGDEKCL